MANDRTINVSESSQWEDQVVTERQPQPVSRDGVGGWSRRRLRGLSLLQRFLILGAILFVSGFVVIGLVITTSTRSLSDRIMQDRLSGTRVAAAGLSETIRQARAELIGHRDMMALSGDRIEPPYASLSSLTQSHLTAFSGGLALVDADGSLLAVSRDSLLPAGSSIPFSVASTAGEDGALTPVFSGLSGGAMVSVIVRLEEARGDLFLAGLIVPADSPLIDLMKTSTEAMATGHAELLDQNGRVIASTEVGTELTDGDHPDFYLQRIAKGTDGVESVDHIPSLDEAGNGDDDRHVMAYVKIPDTEWALAVGGSEDETFGPVSDLRRSLYLWSAAVGAVVAIFGGISVNRIVRPVRSLSLSARAVAAGDLETEIKVSEGGEIAELAEDLEQMRRNLVVSVEQMQHFNAQLEETVADQTNELRARNDELLLVNNVTEALSSTLSTSTVAQQVLSHVSDVEGVMNSTMFLSAGSPSEFRKIETDADHTLTNGPSVDLSTIACEDTCFLSPDAFASMAQVDPLPGTNAVACFPLRSADRLEGLLALFLEDASHSDPDAFNSVRLICRQAAVALQNARLFSELQQKEKLTRKLLRQVLTAQENERQRIARELHDDTAQSLTATLIAIGAVREQLPAESNRQLSQVEDMTKEAIADLRKTILALRPSALDDHGLFAGVRAYAGQRLETAGIEVTFEENGLDSDIEPEIELIIFRVVQEAVNNIARHSQATSAAIKFWTEQDSVNTEVTDDGVGFEAKAESGISPDGTHLGLVGMHERVEFVGGTLSIVSDSSHGTRLVFKVPKRIGELSD